MKLQYSLLLLSLSILHEIECKEYETDILVLGAGWTGVAAARQLTKLGQKNFIIIEGADRVGGRVRHQHFGGKTVELGANWIHGTVGNPIFKLAKKYGLKMVVGFDYDDLIVRTHNGTDVTARAETYMETLEAAIDKSEEMRERKIKRKEPDVTYRAGLAMSGWVPENAIMDAVEYNYFDFDYGVDPKQISLKNGGFYDNYATFKDEDAFVVDQRGFVYLLERVLGEFMKKDDERLHLNSVVQKIQYSKDGVTVTTENGDIYRAKFAICTFSVGVLERGVVTFEPPLPSWKLDVIHNFDSSFYLKIFVKFPEGTKRFWDEETILYHAHPRRGYFTNIQNLEAKNLFPKGTNLLLATLTGEEARRVSRIPKSDVINELDAVFSSIYGSKAVKIEDVVVPDWIDNPLQFGMYSSWPLGVTSKTGKMLRLPVGALYFAGEYTSRDYYGYVHGAWFEGIHEANDVVKCKLKKLCAETYNKPTQRPYYYRA